MEKSFRNSFIIVLAYLLLVANGACADIIFDTYYSGDGIYNWQGGYDVNIWNYEDDEHDLDVAIKFKTGDTAYMLKSISLPIIQHPALVENNNDLFLLLLKDRSDDPGVSTEEKTEEFLISHEVIPTLDTLVPTRVQSAERAVLSPNTSYWLMATVQCNDNAHSVPPNGYCTNGSYTWGNNDEGLTSYPIVVRQSFWFNPVTITGWPVPAVLIEGIPDTMPWAYAGDDVTAYRGDTVTFDGNESTFGSGTSLTYSWAVTSRPTGSVAPLLGDNTVNPTITPDVEGIYVIQLITNDGFNDSEPDTVALHVGNAPPVADAGTDQQVPVDGSVTLDGTASYDPDNDTPLSYQWRFASKPFGSTAQIADADKPIATFVKDLVGMYSVELVVTDAAGSMSAPDVTFITTYNTTPVADAGPDQLVKNVGDTVNLNGTHSYDEDGDPITYKWSITHKPSGSLAQLSDASSPTPSFIADIRGQYRVNLIVLDPYEKGSSDQMIADFANIAPVADAGGNQSVLIGDNVVLDGTNSSDADGDTIGFYWEMISKPVGSKAYLTQEKTKLALFNADVEGTYVVSLTVNDGLTKSKPDTATVVALTAQDAVTGGLTDIVDAINDVPADSLVNGSMANALTNKINSALLLISQGKYTLAINKIENDILPKTDGCANTGEPDATDWVSTCEEQQPIYQMLMETLDVLYGLAKR